MLESVIDMTEEGYEQVFGINLHRRRAQHLNNQCGPGPDTCGDSWASAQENIGVSCGLWVSHTDVTDRSKGAKLTIGFVALVLRNDDLV